MKIFTLFNGLAVKHGGMSRAVLRRSNFFVKNGYDVDILTINSTGYYKKIKDELVKLGLLDEKVGVINIYDYYGRKNSLKSNSEDNLNSNNSLKTNDNKVKTSFFKRNKNKFFSYLNKYNYEEPNYLKRYFGSDNKLPIVRMKNLAFKIINYFNKIFLKLFKFLFTNHKLSIENLNTEWIDENLDSVKIKKLKKNYKKKAYLISKRTSDGFINRVYYNKKGSKLKSNDYKIKDNNTEYLMVERFFNPKNRKLIQKNYLTEDGFPFLMFFYENKKLVNIHLQSRQNSKNSKNKAIKEFKLVKDLQTNFLNDICQEQEEKPFLICDSGPAALRMLDMNTNLAKIISYFRENHHDAPYSIGSHIKDKYKNMEMRVEKSDALITLTRQQRDDFATEFGHSEKMYYLFNFLPKIEENNEKIPNKVSIFARLSSQKNIEAGIKAFEIVLKTKKNAKLNIYGKGENREKSLKKLVKKLNLENNVIFKGYTNDTFKQMSNSIVTLLTSHSEGFGNVVIESMLCSTPVIAFDINYGPRDIIDNGINGFIIENGNIEKLAEKIIELLDNPEKAREMGIAARDKVLKVYSDEKIFNKWQQIFTNINKNKLD